VRPRRTSFDLRGWQASDTTKQDCFALTVMLFYPADMCTTCQGCWPRKGELARDEQAVASSIQASRRPQRRTIDSLPHLVVASDWKYFPKEQATGMRPKNLAELEALKGRVGDKAAALGGAV
jgi:hypothetical protein